MGDTFPNHNSSSQYRKPAFYYRNIGTLDPLCRLGGFDTRAQGFRGSEASGSEVDGFGVSGPEAWDFNGSALKVRGCRVLTKGEIGFGGSVLRVSRSSSWGPLGLWRLGSGFRVTKP